MGRQDTLPAIKADVYNHLLIFPYHKSSIPESTGKTDLRVVS